MANHIKKSAGGMALQITDPARDAGFVNENKEQQATRRADVYVYTFDKFILVIDAYRVSKKARAELVATTASDTDSIHRGTTVTVEHAGHGYQVQLVGADEAGFDIGDRAPVLSRPGLLLIHTGTTTRLAQDIATIRETQVFDSN